MKTGNEKDARHFLDGGRCRTESRVSWAEKEILFGFDCTVATTCFSQCPAVELVQVNSLPSEQEFCSQKYR